MVENATPEFGRRKAGTVRKATDATEEPDVEEISREGFACNVRISFNTF